jgi:hypothetical protein
MAGWGTWVHHVPHIIWAMVQPRGLPMDGAGHGPLHKECARKRLSPGPAVLPLRAGGGQTHAQSSLQMNVRIGEHSPPFLAREGVSVPSQETQVGRPCITLHRVGGLWWVRLMPGSGLLSLRSALGECPAHPPLCWAVRFPGRLGPRGSQASPHCC